MRPIREQVLDALQRHSDMGHIADELRLDRRKVSNAMRYLCATGFAFRAVYERRFSYHLTAKEANEARAEMVREVRELRERREADRRQVQNAALDIALDRVAVARQIGWEALAQSWEADVARLLTEQRMKEAA